MEVPNGRYTLSWGLSMVTTCDRALKPQRLPCVTELSNLKDYHMWQSSQTSQVTMCDRALKPQRLPLMTELSNLKGYHVWQSSQTSMVTICDRAPKHQRIPLVTCFKRHCLYQSLPNWPIVSLLFLFILFSMFFVLIHDITLCFTGSPCCKFSYYNYISILPYYIVIHLTW